MPHQWICSRGHRWEAVVDSAAAAAPGAACPTCGDVGTVWQSDLDGETIVQEFGSLAPTEVPSLIAPLPAARDPSSSSGRMRAAPLRIGNYEVVTELGRGGMGVVYLARHRELDRFVAIKMLLAGEYATDESVRRLHTEAEAVARLQHPNVVQIYDVGEHDGQQYLVLEYVEGGSLARSIAGKPQPPRVAAQLILTLSRTIDHAHASGIVHRDLTPSNVLLQDSAVRSRKSEVGDRKSEIGSRGSEVRG